MGQKHPFLGIFSIFFGYFRNVPKNAKILFFNKFILPEVNNSQSSIDDQTDVILSQKFTKDSVESNLDDQTDVLLSQKFTRDSVESNLDDQTDGFLSQKFTRDSVESNLDAEITGRSLI